MAFTEPASAFNALAIDAHSTDTCIIARDKDGLALEIRNVHYVGWWIEARYDQVQKSIRRQPFTGRQEQCALEKLHCSVKDGRAEIATATGESLVLSLADGSFSLLRQGAEYFKSTDAPFRSHRDPIDISEGIMSLKATHFAPGQFPALGAFFQTRMTRFRYPRPAGTVLGIPGQAGEADRNGYRFELYNTDDPTHIPLRNPLYQSWPILIHRGGGGWVGVFHDNPARTFIDVGDFYPEAVTFESITGNTRLFIMHSAEISGITQTLGSLLGRAVFPPAWAFGYQQCRFSYTSTEEVSRIAASFREKKIPCDALHFDIHYMDGYRVFTKDPNHFSNLKECVEGLHEQGFRAVCIVDPGVKAEEEFPLFKKVKKTGAFLKSADGEPFIVQVWPGACVLPDFAEKKMRELWSETQRAWTAEYCFDGIWNDMNEPANFDGRNGNTSNAMTARGSIRDEWNLYGYGMAKASALGWSKHKPGGRSFIISRSGYPGIQQFAINWQGDNHAWWEHLRLAIDTTIAYSLCGSLYTGADLPGFNGNPSDDLAVRFFQLGAFLPFFRGHSIFFARDKEPFAFEPAAAARIQSAIELRYSLLREWYSGFERAARSLFPTHLPVVTAHDNPARDQFLLFEKFLIAPVIERGAEQRQIFLPPGRWYSLGNVTDAIEGGMWIAVPVTLDSIPVFVREGSIVVRNTVAKNAAETLRGPERYEIYPDRSGNAEGYWYNDDFESLESAGTERITLRYRKEDGSVRRD